MTEEWIDFRWIKSHVPIQTVLEHYRLLESLKKRGDQLTGCCPIHSGTNRRQFSVSIKKNVFQCFSGHCEAKGNVLKNLAYSVSVGCTMRQS